MFTLIGFIFTGVQQSRPMAKEECPQIAHKHFRWCPSNMWPKVLTYVALLFHYCYWSVHMYVSSSVFEPDSTKFKYSLTMSSNGQKFKFQYFFHPKVTMRSSPYNWTPYNTDLWPHLACGLLFYTISQHKTNLIAWWKGFSKQYSIETSRETKLTICV